MPADFMADFAELDLELDMLECGVPLDEVSRRRTLASGVHDAVYELHEAADRVACDLGRVLEGLQDEEDPTHRERVERAWREFEEALGDIRAFLEEAR